MGRNFTGMGGDGEFLEQNWWVTVGDGNKIGTAGWVQGKISVPVQFSNMQYVPNETSL